MAKGFGVYRIRNLLNGKVYVGSTSTGFRRRWGMHRNRLRAGRHANQHLQAAWDKYGEAAFAFEVLEVVADAAEVLPREQDWLDRLEPWRPEVGYNISPTAGSCLGYRHDASARRKMSLALR